MDFLRALFGDQALTYEQLQQAAQSRGFDVVNAQGGAYVPKAQFDVVQGSLTPAGKIAYKQFSQMLVHAAREAASFLPACGWTEGYAGGPD